MSSKDPPFNFSDILQLNECLKILKGPFFHIFGTMTRKKPQFSFSKSFQSLKGSHLIFCNRMDVKKSQRPPLYSFRHFEIFQNEQFLTQS